MPLQHVVYILYSPTADRHYIGQSSDFASAHRSISQAISSTRSPSTSGWAKANRIDARGVAQPGSVPTSKRVGTLGAVGREFESHHPDQF